jgi:hypothetical protein
VEQFGHLGHQILSLGTPDGPPGHQDRVVSVEPGADLAPSGPKDATGPVPFDRAADSLRGDGGRPSGPGREKQYHPVSVHRTSLIEDPADLSRSHLLQRQADNRTRPLRRRRAMIARPARVRMRIRKPWVFARWRLFGWYVRLPLAMTIVPSTR